MDKPAPSDHPIHELLKNRWSPLAFERKPVTTETLHSLLEAARWAPSSFNEQPWSFLVATQDQPDAFAQMLDVLAPPNQVWAKNAWVLLIAVAKGSFARNGRLNRHATHDVGQALAHLTFQATHHGLAVHQMAGFFVDKAQEVYGIPEGHEAVTAVAVGWPGSLEQLPENLQARERGERRRRPLSEQVFWGKWGGSE